MKKAIYLFFAILIGMIIVIYMADVPLPKTVPDEITFMTLPSPPNHKVINRREDIQFLFDAIERLKLRPILNTEKGWQLSLEFNGGTILIINQKIKINSKWFKCDDDIAAIFHEYYLQMDYPESTWGADE